MKASAVALLCLTVVAAPLAVEAQTAVKVYRVALVFSAPPVSEMAGPEPVHPAARAFVRALRALGYVEGQNVVLERRSAEGHFERFGDILRELVELKVDVIVTAANPAAREALRATTTVPIVMGVSVDPVGEGFVRSLARPGGNVTGLTRDVGPELYGKQLELLKEALPKITRVAVLGSRFEWESPRGQSLRAAATALGLTLLHAESAPNDHAHAFAVIARERPEALFVVTDPDLHADRRRIVDFATRSRLPMVGWNRDFTEAGGLMSYGVDGADLFRRAAGYVDRILKGAKPADLPVEQPTKFELAVNLKTAKTFSGSCQAISF
jgi:putative ABC transport system substrate-binding protein